ncbi:uncharacterized protein A4U43_C04F34180 [Asparagus officinalis]|uniref:DnaJ homologue subfamily C member 28 conserved domain-containing protein n=1 Tax=Asparagus officinalis TaxID=4686 RepID=A0A5P1F689_ASPOF|nr:uncharacterized protein A4U43_C04F34180 [Asparagus officinalis]
MLRSLQLYYGGAQVGEADVDPGRIPVRGAMLVTARLTAEGAISSRRSLISMAGSIARLMTRPPLNPVIGRRILVFLPRSVWTRPDSDPASSSSKEKKQQRQQGHRLASVVDAVNDRKLPPELRSRPNAVRSETDIINVAERRIWQSMEEGHFENLPGRGKPLDFSTNAHADPAEDTLYRILSRNGCAPEWVELNKEIRCNIAEWRLALKKAQANRTNNLGSTWPKDLEYLKEQMRDINIKVLRYNLIVPFGRQMFGLKWEKEIDKLE